MWHDDIIFKLKQNGISGNLLNLLSNFLRNRKQRVVLNGQTSFRADVNAGVPQGSILQKQPFRGVLSKMCSENMQQIYRRVPMPKCDFNKVALQLY